jgi:hypothetical protein
MGPNETSRCGLTSHPNLTHPHCRSLGAKGSSGGQQCHTVTARSSGTDPAQLAATTNDKRCQTLADLPLVRAPIGPIDVDLAWPRGVQGSSPHVRSATSDNQSKSSDPWSRTDDVLRQYPRVAVTDVSLWTPIAAGVLGIAGALAGTAVTQRATRKREDRALGRERDLDQVRYDRDQAERLRERRAALYVDLAEYVQSHETGLEAVTDEYGSRQTPTPDLQHPDRLTARVRLCATPQVRERWMTVVQASKTLERYSKRGYPHVR